MTNIDRGSTLLSCALKIMQHAAVQRHAKQQHDSGNMPKYVLSCAERGPATPNKVQDDITHIFLQYKALICYTLLLCCLNFY